MTTSVFALLFLMQTGWSGIGPAKLTGDFVTQQPITSMPGWYQTMHERLIREDSIGTKKDVTELAQNVRINSP